MGYSKLRRRVIKSPKRSGSINKKLEIISPNMSLTKHVAKLEGKNKEKEKGEL